MSAPPIGVRLHNPGCMERGIHDSLLYEGELRPSSAPPYRQFQDDAYGFRAMVECLRAYQKHDGIRTIGEAIARWSPASAGNPTMVYALNVAKACGVLTTQIISFEDYWTPLLQSMSTQENGQGWFSNSDIALGISLAGSAK